MGAIAGAIALALSACGGGGGGAAPAPVVVATSDAKLAAAPATTAAVANQPFTFPSGVPNFGTTEPTTLVFTSTSATPAFSISAGGKSATGTTTFGSCIFKVTQSTFDPPSPLAVGNTITVHPCDIVVDTQGQPANGQAQPRSVSVVLGTAPSAATPVTVSINPSGQIVLNGQEIGTIPVAPVTGGT